MALGATGQERLAYEMGRITALEARAVGIHVPFAPVLDVNNNPDNPIINVRSFGEDPAQVARMGISFVRGVQENGAIATGKHFPGHGDTETDSHVGLPVIRHDRARMDSVELRPFKDAIDAGMGAIMTAQHLGALAQRGHSGAVDALPPRAHEHPARRDGLRWHHLHGRHGHGGDLAPPQLGRSGSSCDRSRERRHPHAGFGPGGRGWPGRGRDDGADLERRIDESVLRLLETKERLELDEERLVPLDRVPRSSAFRTTSTSPIRSRAAPSRCSGTSATSCLWPGRARPACSP